METVRLPAHLTNVDACRTYNRRVRDGSLLLDWTDVRTVDDAALAALVEGIPLDPLPDAFNVDSVPEALVAAITAKLSPAAAPPKKKAAKKPKTGVTPSAAVWKSPSELPPPASRPAPASRRAPPAPSILAKDIPPAATIRADLEARVVAELLGPAAGDTEELDDARLRPRDRYLVGVLAPRRLRIKREEVDALGAGADDDREEGGDEDEGLSADTMFPSSIGVSFCVPVGTKLSITATWGHYTRAFSETRKRETGDAEKVWKRKPMGGTLSDVEIKEGPFGPRVVDKEQPDVVVRGIANPLGDVLVVSLFLVNGQDEPADNKDMGWLFQAELTVKGADGRAVFVGRALQTPAVDVDDANELRSIAMLFRNRVEFAVGHGTSVAVDVAPDDPRHAVCVRTRTIPRHELPQQQARRPPTHTDQPLGPDEDPNLLGLELDMKELACAKPEDLRAKLMPIVHAYGKWIEVQAARIGTPEARLEDFEEVARTSLKACRVALNRIRGGIELLASNAQAAQAFQFANRAMWQQRVHTVLADERRRFVPCSMEEADIPKNRTWRTFQLAFILLTLEGITDLGHPDRIEPVSALADLLWFPTGGGKTEAYLGCTAYVLALRRLQGEVAGRSGEHGVAVLMRYTLRLLTIQQFQRATALICACEEIRRDALAAGDPRWGHEPFRIGLWVGARTTPNKTEQADEALKLERKSEAPRASTFGRGSPVQLKSCPWCGALIDPARHVKVFGFARDIGRTITYCGDERGVCLFSARRSETEGLPVVVVDEEIYRCLPALLISTVDKLAQMPWNPEVQMLFGQVNGRCSRHGFRSPGTKDADSHPKADRMPAAKTREHGPLRPPDLIIQDELHLISGPLGTLTGLYETAVDELCTWEVDGKRVRPKVIASTATVRRAKEQVHALFARRLAVFPPPALDAEDSFFAVERRVEDLPGRLYLGICAPGRRLKASLIRVYVAFLGAAQALYLQYGRHADAWMTLVGYFGSLRELAGMRRLVDDDVKNRMFRMRRTGLADRRLGEPKELTSRLGATEIPALLDLLEVPFDPADEDAAKDDRRKRTKPIDVLLATNMISVGVDVQRLGLMVCAGQPKTTAEYIQATSRVGRRHPGIVCTIYNWSRPRDLSHYETFEHYHATFYEHVEALSVTPFASRSLDRGLSALLVSLVRQQGTVFNPNDAAATFDPSHPTVKHAIETIARRAELVEESKTLGIDVRKALASRVQEWAARAKGKPGLGTLGYREAKDGKTRGLLTAAGPEDWETFTCLNSLRDVEPSVTLLFDEGRMDDDPGTHAPDGGSR
jgi:hypothetical protein